MDDIDKLLNKIEKDSNYSLLGNCFCLQGDPEFKFFRVKPIEEVYQEAFVDFSTGISCPFVTVGISEDKNELWRMKNELVDNGKKEFMGNVIVDDSLRVIEGEPTLNEIATRTLRKMYDHNLTLFRMGVNRNWLLLGVAASPKVAQTHITTIRTLGGRKENPKKP